MNKSCALDLCDYNSLRLAYGRASQASQAILGSYGNSLVRHFENIRWTHQNAFLAGIAEIGLHVDQIYFIIS